MRRRLGGGAMAVRNGVAAAAVAAVVSVGLASCAGDGDDPTTAGRGTASESPSESASLTPTVPLPESTPSAEPASGPQLDVDGVRVNGLAKWKQTYDTPFVDIAQGRSGSVMLSVKSTYGEQLSLKQAERYFWDGDGTRKPRGYRAQDGVVLGGINAGYYISGDPGGRSHVITAWDSGYVVKIEVRFADATPPDRQQELLASMIASYESPRTA